jgi:hypothetical protein
MTESTLTLRLARDSVNFRVGGYRHDPGEGGTGEERQRAGQIHHVGKDRPPAEEIRKETLRQV